MASSGAPASASTFTSTNPATGEVVGTFPVHTSEDAQRAVERARIAARWWGAIGFAERRRRLMAFKAILARRSEELCAVVRAENGKSDDDAFIEVLLSVLHLDWAARHARRTLAPHRVRPGLLMLNQKATIRYAPVGVVGVIGPWNYPVFTPMGAIAYALAAGNAVVFKPSELTPAVSVWLVDAFAAVVPEHQVLQLLTGAADTGAALCRSGVDKLVFTGSARVGRAVMATCADTLTPVVMECGGNDAMIVDDDADLDAAATAAVWGGLQNTGQACISVERVYVTDAVHDRFVERVADLAGAVREADVPRPQLGPMTSSAQIAAIEGHLTDALARGARAVVGGPAAIRPPYVNPVVLVDVPADARIMQEETFGPILPIARVRDADEAVRRASTSDNLGTSVFARRAGADIARRLRAGMTSVNAVAVFAAVPALPWGGQGESGFGRIHGEEGLMEFVRPHAITEQRFDLPVDMMSFGRPEWLIGVLDRAMKLRHGRG
ncbi:MAG: aldehyde dehydrogenase family protein [Egibacteraceae bacterium]